jgi:hypothetical protein
MMQSALDLLKFYNSYVGLNEAPEVFHRWSLLTCLSAALSRNVWAANGHFRIYPNLYVMLMGDPGTRKSTAVGIAKEVLKNSGFMHFAATQTSKEQFYRDLEIAGLENPELSSTSQQFVCADEFNNFIGENNTGFISALTELFDCKDEFKARFKKDVSIINNPSVQILGGNTHANFGIAFPPSIIHNGFLSRMLLIYGQRTTVKIAWLRAPKLSEREKLQNHLQSMRTDLKGELTYTPEAIRALEEIYHSWEDLEDSRFTHYAQRRHVHLLKLCVICACAALKLVIQKQDVILANTLLYAAEEDFSKALGEFGKARTSEEASLIMNILYNAQHPLSSSQLYKAVANQIDKITVFEDIMAGLNRAGKIENIGKGFVAKVHKRNPPAHIDIEILAELAHSAAASAVHSGEQYGTS